MTEPQKQTSKAVPVGTGLVLASAGLMAFLGVWEPSRDPGLVYADKLANGLPTVCKGITRHVTSTPIIVGERWPKEKCDREEKRAVSILQNKLLTCFKINPPQSVFDMATSHGWNLGVGRTCGSQAMAAWNQGDWVLGCRRLLQADSGKLVWVYAGGKFIPGLKNRRTAERNYCWEAL